MGDFASDWLDLRAPADARARSGTLIDAAGALLEHRAAETSSAPLRIVDLGAGNGAAARALAPRWPTPQVWTLYDADPALLAVAQDRAADPAHATPGVTIETAEVDLREHPKPFEAPPDLVTASALFDLVSETWLATFVAPLAAARIPLLALLSYDGRMRATPDHPDDPAMVTRFNAHQRTEKSFGPALGPDGVARLAMRLTDAGYRVQTAPSDWVLDAGRDDALIAAHISGWANAAREIAPEDSARIANWESARQAQTERLIIGHMDLLALPPIA